MRERFRPDPFAAEPGRLLYRTGDRARWLPDGSLEYLGRRDRQVKIRGQRVESDEVERVLEGSPGVEAAVVSERAGRLEAQVVGDLDEAVVWKHLRMHLHSGMVPATLTVVAELPRSITGKADRAAVAEELPRAVTGRPPATSRQQLEEDGAALVTEMGDHSLDTPLFDPVALDVPVVVGAGAETLPHHRETALHLAALAPNGRFREIPGAGHAAHVTHPAAFAELITLSGGIST